LLGLEFEGGTNFVNASLKAKAKAWTFKAKAKAIKCGLKAPRGLRPKHGLEDYTSANYC